MLMSEHEARIKLSEIIAGKQSRAAEVISDVTENPVEIQTIRELLDFIISSADELNIFWD